jgi:aspartyl aminopeptidase
VLSSWLDRPLGIAGKVAVADSTNLKPQIRYVHPKELRLTVPGYAIHLNREMNNGIAYDKQKDMQPLYATVAAGSEVLRFEEELAAELGVAAKDILEYELFAYNADEPCLVGADGMLISAPRLDNMSSVYSIIKGICQAQPGNDLKVAAIFHHEEIGSRTKEGAASAFFQMALEKIYLSCGYDREHFLRAIYGGMMISADVSQGRHPAQPEKYDPTNSAILNDGFAIKKAGGQSYATDCEAIAIVKMLCRRNGIFCQDYYNRSNLAGGSTIGAIASAFLPMRIADVGIPLLSMHSARECAGVEDICGFTEFMKEFFAIDFQL